MAAILPIAGPDPKTPEWEALRFYDPQRTPPVVFGASEAAAICGISPYESTLHIYLRKRRELPPKKQTAAMRIGLKMEPVIISEFAEQHPELHVDSPRPMFFHGTLRFLAATPDAMASDRKNPVECWPIDAKRPGFRRAEEFGDEGTDELPDDILMQAQQQMLVLGCEKQQTVALMEDDLRVFTVKANETIQKAIAAAAEELMQRIIDGRPPEPHWTHPETPTLIKELYRVGDEVIHLSQDTALIWSNFQRLKEEIREREKQAEELRARVMHVMDGVSVGILPQGEKCIVAKQVNVAAHQRKATSYIKLTEGDAEKWAAK